jgi:ABC-2 type transport system permease protein
MNDVGLAFHQFRYDQKTFWRDPTAVFFTVVLPLIFLFIFVTIFGNERLESRGNIKLSTYYVPGLVTLGVISATFVSLAITLTELRENGILKRVRGTPVPSWVFIAGQIGTALVTAFLLVLVLTGLGRVLYGVALPGETLPGVVLALLVGAASFCCLGIALTSVVPTANSAPAVTNAIVLPLYFISGIFFSMDEAPGWLQSVADVFPIVHLSEAMLTAFDPRTEGAGIEFGHLGIVALWGLGGLIVAARFFRWTPRSA